MAVTLILCDFLSNEAKSSSDLLTEKFKSLSPTTYPIKYTVLGAVYVTLTGSEWKIGLNKEFNAFQGRNEPSGLFSSCKELFDYYLDVLHDYEVFSGILSGNGSWEDCWALDFCGDIPDGMEEAFNDLEEVFKENGKLEKLELSQPVVKSTCITNAEIVGEGPFTNRVLNWLKFVNGREGGDGYGDHAPVFNFELIRTSVDNRGNTYETEMIPMLCSCKFLKTFDGYSRRKKTRR